MHRLPCSIISLDIADFTGKHTLNVQGKIQKENLDKNGKNLKTETIVITKEKENKYEHANFEQVKKQFENFEGCRIKGEFKVMRLPGNFHISSHSFADVLKEFYRRGIEFGMNLTHTINHISFGNEKDIHIIQKKFHEGIITPLDNYTVIDNMDGRLFDYYLKIVPTIYHALGKKRDYNIFQFSSNYKKTKSRMIPTLFFRYDLSPIQVKFTQYQKNMFEIVINCWAIIGGMFTIAIAGILYTLILRMINNSNFNEKKVDIK